jgi:HAD superfamily hydrolase (TIGR01509 family)
MTETVIFDMDGVVIDSEIHWEKPDLDFLRSIAPDISQEEIRKRTGMNMNDTYDLLKANHDIRISLEEFIAYYDIVAEDILNNKVSLLDGFIELIQDLKSKGFRTALVSSSQQSWIDIAVNRFKLSRYFDLILSAQGLGFKGKPNPEIYLHAADKLGVNPSQCVVIEDSPSGIQSAKAAGMVVIGTSQCTGDKHDISRANLEINHFSELSVERVRELVRTASAPS